MARALLSSRLSERVSSRLLHESALVPALNDGTREGQARSRGAKADGHSDVADGTRAQQSTGTRLPAERFDADVEGRQNYSRPAIKDETLVSLIENAETTLGARAAPSQRSQPHV